MKSYNKKCSEQESKQRKAIDELKKYFPGLPDDLVIDGNVNLAGRYINVLPDNLTINGSLDVRDSCYLDQFPDNLIIKGNFYIDSCIDGTLPVSLQVHGQLSIVSGADLPDNFSVGGDLVVSEYTEFLPDNLTVGGSLNLKGTKIKELPAGLKVHGNLCLSELPITYLPTDLYVGGNLDCYKTSIKNIPQSVHIGGGLNISHTEVRVFPKQLKELNGCLSINSCRIKYLPDDLIVHGSLYADGSSLVELPKNLRVDKWLDLARTVIEELPEDLVAGGTIDLSECPIEKLPSGLKVYGDLDISGTLIKELPEDLVVYDTLDINDSLIERLPAFVNAGSLDLKACRVPTDILPEGFSVTGDLRLCVCSKEKPEPLKLPANLKVGGNLIMDSSLQRDWPKNLFVGGDVKFGDSEIRYLPTDATIKGKLIFLEGLFYGSTMVLELISGSVSVPYSVVVPKYDIDRYRYILSGTMASIDSRLRDYLDDKTKVEILPLAATDNSVPVTSGSLGKRKKDLLSA
jgi:hypothetical protein